ncbi:hypothetical protein ACWHLZ_46430 [Streptomyces chartreusis]
MATQPTSSLVLRGHSATIWLDGGAILINQNGIRRRIPLQAVEKIRVDDESQRSVEVVLTAAVGTPGTTYRMDCRSSAAVTTFADTVNRALPQRDEGEPRRDVAELVEVLPNEACRPPGDPRWRIGALILLGLYLVGLATLIVAGEPDQWIMWLVGLAPLLMGGIICSSSVARLYDCWILRRRGISVLATYCRPSSGTRRVFQFTDAEGIEREVRLHYDVKRITTDPARVEVTYDPDRPERTTATLTATGVLGRLVVDLFGVAILLPGLYFAPYQLMKLLFL